MRKSRDDVLSYAIGDKFLLGIAAHIREGQDRQRGLVGQRERRTDTSSGSRSGTAGRFAEQDAVYVYGPRDVS